MGFKKKTAADSPRPAPVAQLPSATKEELAIVRAAVSGLGDRVTKLESHPDVDAVTIEKRLKALEVGCSAHASTIATIDQAVANIDFAKVKRGLNYVYVTVAALAGIAVYLYSQLPTAIEVPK